MLLLSSLSTFDKFVYAKRELGTQMKATGEVMAIGSTFEQAIMKAVRGAEIGHDCLISPKMLDLDDKTIHDRLSDCTDERLFVVYEAQTEFLLMRYTASLR